MKACLYLVWWSWVNRLKAQVSRLRKPKYAIAALLGAAYMYFFFFRFMFSSHRQSGPGMANMFGGGADALPLLETAAALAVLLYVVLQWLLPKGNAALEFTQAEVAMLFAAPLSRRTLLHYRLIRIQGPLFFGALLFWGLSGAMWRSGSGAWNLPAYWLFFSNLQFHALGAGFVRTEFETGGRSPWLRRMAVSTLVLFSLGLSWWLTRRGLPPFPSGEQLGPASVIGYVQQVAATGPVFWLLEPCRWLVRPFMAGGAADAVMRLLPAAGVLVLQYVWIASRVAPFEEASLQQSEKRAKAAAAIAAGRWQGAGGTIKSVAPPFPLRPRGMRFVAIFWKNLIAAHTVFSLPFWVGALAVLGLVMLGGRTLGGASSPVFVLSSVLVGMGAVMLFAAGPQVLSLDLRYDFTMMDVLKALPLRGRQLLLGEVLAPAIILTLTEWVLLGLLAGVVEAHGHGKSVIKAAPTAFLLGAAIVTPAWNLASLLVLNGTCLLFPSWARPGMQHAQGIEATGHAMLMLFGHLLAMALLCLGPAAMAALFVFLARKVLALTLLVPGAALAAAAVLAGEIIFLLFTLGDLLDRLDISDERPDTA